jgi:hypothetical protein
MPLLLHFTFQLTLNKTKMPRRTRTVTPRKPASSRRRDANEEAPRTTVEAPLVGDLDEVFFKIGFPLDDNIALIILTGVWVAIPSVYFKTIPQSSERWEVITCSLKHQFKVTFNEPAFYVPWDMPGGHEKMMNRTFKELMDKGEELIDQPFDGSLYFSERIWSLRLRSASVELTDLNYILGGPMKEDGKFTIATVAFRLRE